MLKNVPGTEAETVVAVMTAGISLTPGKTGGHRPPLQLSFFFPWLTDIE